MTITLLDGPIGTQLLARGIPLPTPQWSAEALLTHPDAVMEIHRRYGAAGANVHTTNTFRTTRRACGKDWEHRARCHLVPTQMLEHRKRVWDGATP